MSCCDQNAELHARQQRIMHPAAHALGILDPTPVFMLGRHPQAAFRLVVNTQSIRCVNPGPRRALPSPPFKADIARDRHICDRAFRGVARRFDGYGGRCGLGGGFCRGCHLGSWAVPRLRISASVPVPRRGGHAFGWGAKRYGAFATELRRSLQAAPSKSARPAARNLALIPTIRLCLSTGAFAATESRQTLRRCNRVTGACALPRLPSLCHSNRCDLEVQGGQPCPQVV